MAAGATYSNISSITLGASSSSVSISSIPSTYTDLVLVVSAISTGTAQPDVYMRVNGSSSSYSRTRLGGNGSSAFTTNITGEGAWVLGPMENSGSGTNMIVNLMNYSNTTTFKTSLIRGNDSVIAVQAMVGLWQSTAAINSVTFFPEPAKGDFASGSTFTLYGIAAA